MPASFEIVPTPAGLLWRLVGAGERVVALSSDVYGTERAARSSAKRFRELAPEASVSSVETGDATAETEPEVVFTISNSDAGWAWSLRESDSPLARSPVTYASAADAERARLDAVAASSQSPERVDASVRKRFDPSTLDKAVIALPLLKSIEESPANKGHRVIIDLNLLYEGGRDAARKRLLLLIKAFVATTPSRGVAQPRVLHRSAGANSQYVVATLSGDHIRRLVRYDRILDPLSRAEATDTAPADDRDDAFVAALEKTFERQDEATGADPNLGGQDGARDNGQALFEASRQPGAIYRIWPDFEVEPLLTSSIAAVKSDAARVAFSALGEGIVWAVVDSGVDGTHPHFETHHTLDLPKPLYHRDFTDPESNAERVGADATALDDPYGHGTHVAGIVAGEHLPDEYQERKKREARASQGSAGEVPGESAVLDVPDATESEGADPEASAEVAPLMQVVRERGEKSDDSKYRVRKVGPISGVAPKCKVLSLRVLDRAGKGHTSDIIEALRYVYDLNQGGRFMRVHGVNLSVGYEFDAEWFACGHSPLCQEVDLLVRSGVVVVVAAGNTGYGQLKTREGTWKASHDLSINDPGNAERAITVGSTHPREPHRFGVSFFSSKGPTGDGRVKPDLVAPGEKVVSCAAGKERQAAIAGLEVDRLVDTAAAQDPLPACHYLAQSGTSMAAPHVSGAVAAFLSIRREFIGRSDDVKQLFLDNATDLGRDPYFQGRGLLDLMRTIQAV